MAHTNSHPSPVSPLQPSSPSLPAQSPSVSTQTPSAPVPQTVSNNPSPPIPTATSLYGSQTSNSQSNPVQTDWIPFTFRWYFLILPIAASVGFSIALSYLCSYSQRNHGLGKDDGSSAILFGWRFTPTLVAVMYTQITVILFEDVKRTEPFARLAKAPLGGASAYGTLLQTPKAWWAIFVDLTFKRKKVGKTSWALICSTVINVLALLAISPLSSALLASEEVALPKTIDFTRLAPKNDAQLPMNARRETYFRTISALTQNITTSIWVSNTSLTFPFWPSTSNTQLGPNLKSSYGSWRTETTAFTSSLECQNMTLERAEIQNRTYAARDWHGYIYNGTQPMVSFVLQSSDGCKYELDVHPAIDLAYHGGVMWSSATTFLPVRDETLNIEKLVVPMSVSSDSPSARLRTSDKCRDRDMILSSTPWTSPLTLSRAEPLWPNQTYKRSPEFRMRALLCDSRYSTSTRTVTASMSLGKTPLLENAPGGNEKIERISQSLVDLAMFQNVSLQNQWKSYVDANSMNEEAELTTPAEPSPVDGPTLITQRPGFSGMAAVLGILSAWNVTSLLDDPYLSDQAANIKGRFFMETVRESLGNPGLTQSETLPGKVTAVEDRVIVLREVGITLAVLFMVSFILLVTIFWMTRLPQRPLNLPSDPSSTVGMSILLDPTLTAMNTLRRLHSASRSDIHNALRSETFFTTNSTMYENMTSFSNSTSPSKKTKQRRNWKPRAIQLKCLFALGIFLALILTALLVLNVFSSRSQLSQKAFTYQADVSKFGLSFSTFAPISIAPTLLSVIITLWWDQLDMTFRLLQPYISMSRGPTPIRSGAGLTYRSKTWIGAAVKAGVHRHWVLFFVAIGSTLCQVLTVSMSALFERKSDFVVHEAVLNRTLEARQVPVISTIDVNGRSDPLYQPRSVLNRLFKDHSNNWLYTSTIELSLDGSQPAWSHDEWSFVPVELAQIPNSGMTQKTGTGDFIDDLVSSTNVTFQTSAMRAWLECEPVSQIANLSSWLEDVAAEDLEEIANGTDVSDGFTLNRLMFSGTPSATSAFSQPVEIQCCANGTISDPQPAVFGYWSPTRPESGFAIYPYAEMQWPLSFVTKWVVGKPRSFYDRMTPRSLLYFENAPSIQAARCSPVVDIAGATVSVDKDTGVVYSHTITDSPRPADGAWTEAFIRRDISSSSKHYMRNYTGKLNVTTSFGVLFLDALLGAADRDTYGEPAAGPFEPLDDNAFNIRDQSLGMNMDLMTYSMYALAEKEPEALLNYTTLVTHANRTFQAFFQQFARSQLSMSEGSWAYQKIDDDSMDALGRPVDENGTSIPEYVYPALGANRTVASSVSNRIQILHMNPTATYLSIAIIVWLVATTAIITCLQRRYTKSMLRNVELIADVLVLIAGSDNLLRLVQEKGLSLKKNTQVKTKLGWFKGRDGEVRWGVEVVGGRNAVQWVDAPKKEFT